MAVGLYVDECVDMRIVAGLRRRHVDAFSVVEAGFAGESDERHMERAIQLGRVVLTTDQDFLRMAHARTQAARPFSGVIFILPRTTVGDAIRAILVLMALPPSDFEARIHWVP